MMMGMQICAKVWQEREGRRLPPLISTTQHASGCPSLLPRHPHHTLEATKTFILEEKRIYVVNMQIHTLLIRNSSYRKGQLGDWRLSTFHG